MAYKCDLQTNKQTKKKVLTVLLNCYSAKKSYIQSYTHMVTTGHFLISFKN